MRPFGLRLVPLAVLLFLLATSLGAFFVTQNLVVDQEQRLLREKADEVVALLANSFGSIESSLRILGTLGASTDPSAAPLFAETAAADLRGSDAHAHEIVMSLYGGISKGERNRIKIRVRTAMAAQASIEGRFLGGRPPYGYVLADGGPHPNPTKAAAGQQLHRLEPDPAAAAIVRRIFEDFIEGKGLYAIATELTREGVPSPSAYDPGRNRHRADAQGAWRNRRSGPSSPTLDTTGRQVWNRQRRDEVLIDVDDVGLGHQTKMRWNHPDTWVWSDQPAHEAIIQPDLFLEAQKAFSSAKRRPPRLSPSRRYLLSGLIRCAICGRRMQGQQNHNRPYHRCRFADEYGIEEAQHPRNVYVKEESVMPGLDQWLASRFDQEHLEETSEILAGATQADPDTEARQAVLTESIRDCDRRLGQYQAVLDEGADPQIVARWMAKVQRERRELETHLGRPVPGGKLTRPQVRALVESLKDIVTVLAEADQEDKADLYSELGVNLTYHPEGRVDVQMKPRGVKVRVGGPTHHLLHRHPSPKRTSSQPDPPFWIEGHVAHAYLDHVTRPCQPDDKHPVTELGPGKLPSS